MRSKPKIKIERTGDGEYTVYEYGPRCKAPLFVGDIAEAEEFARDYADDLQTMGFRP